MAGRVTRSKGRKCTPGNYEKYLGNKYEDPEGFEPKFLNSEVGHGLFAVKDFPKGAFLLEYKGETISEQEAGRREYTSHHSYQFFFQHEGKTMCIDASDTNHLARLVNDSAPSKRSCNARMRKIISCSGTLHLCLFSLRDIEQGEEIRYDYAAKGLSWRKKEKLYNKIALSVDSRNEDDGNYETVLDSEDDGGLNSGLSNFKRLQHINEAIIECCNGKNDKGKACIKESGYKCRDENEQGGSAASRGRNEDEPGILTPLEDVIHTDPEFAPDSGDRDKQDSDVAPDSGDRDKQDPDVATDSGDSGKQDSDVAPDSGDRDKQDPDVAPDSGDRDKQNPDVAPDSGDSGKQDSDVAPDSGDRDKQDPDVAPDSGDSGKQDSDLHQIQEIEINRILMLHQIQEIEINRILMLHQIQEIEINRILMLHQIQEIEINRILMLHQIQEIEINRILMLHQIQEIEINRILMLHQIQEIEINRILMLHQIQEIEINRILMLHQIQEIEINRILMLHQIQEIEINRILMLHQIQEIEINRILMLHQIQDIEINRPLTVH
ncbi:uncharacterized protein LOC115920925 [Strongylocentrotus purpuratus]|uniref:SET domain-containing protein n=1 Tax=Strongylocentrotus purpuratus TaxID=7668 RepID=A0A7M7NAR7_STRPU|nr:uncharacterized protein LOC115920925 [Strongylocentrotus purpuratus]XP_030833569.1 uncharacterized protein LOC115920925 [Strongylocentrotus purpuratus]